MNLMNRSFQLMILGAVLIPTAIWAQKPRNIIQIIADDMSWADLSNDVSTAGNGSPYYQTPRIDALAQGGMSFTSAYVQPVCSPTRAALFTGQYAPRNGLHNVGSLNGGGDQTLLVGPDDGNAILTSAVTLGEMLQSAGYITAHVGKFHCTQNTEDIVGEHGFDFNIGGTNSGGPSGNLPYFAQQSAGGNWQFGNSHGPALDAYAEPYSQSYIDQILTPFANGNNPQVLLGTPKHLNDAMADATIDFLADRVDDGASFFINVAFNAVHSEVNARPDLEAKYNAIPPSTNPNHDRADYAGLLEGMDQAIGRIVDYVEQQGLSNDTVIVFLSDNGGTGATDNFPLAGSKGTFSEGGIRVPLIFYQPGTIAPGVCSEAVHVIDFYPTYAEMAVAAVPQPEVHTLDGESLGPILHGEKTALNRNSLYYHFPGYQNNAAVPLSMIIHDADDGHRYKLIYFYENRAFELFDLSNDLSESTDLIVSGMTSGQFEIAQQMSTELAHWLNEIEAELPTVRSTGAAVPSPQHSPMIRFDLGNSGLGMELTGQSKGVLRQLGIQATVQAEGQNALFSAIGAGIGIDSDQDSGGPNVQRRIDGSLPSAEGLTLTMLQDVFLKQIDCSQFSTDGSETLTLEFLSGDNPFAEIDGYQNGGFAVTDTQLTYSSTTGGSGSVSVTFGILDQDEVLLTAGTTIRITSNPATNGGIILTSLGFAVPHIVNGAVGDVNRDGQVDLLDVAPFVDLLVAGDFQFEADANSDGQLDLLDIGPFVEILSGP